MSVGNKDSSVSDFEPGRDSLFRALFEGAPGLFLALDPQLNIVAVTDAYLAATMTKRADILGKWLFEVFPDNPDDIGANGVSNLRRSLNNVLEYRTPDTMAVQKYDIRKPIEQGGGFEVRYWSPINSPVLDAGGNVSLIVHRVEDVTEFVRLKEAEGRLEEATQELRDQSVQMQAELLQRAEELVVAKQTLAERQKALLQMQLLMEAMPDTVLVADANNQIVLVNAQAQEMFGFERDELLGQPVEMLIPNAQMEAKSDALLAHKDGHLVPVGINVSTVTIKERKVTILVVRDITQRKEAEEELSQLNAELEQRVIDRTAELQRAKEEADVANRTKSEFLSRMSHELRTPLNAVMGFAQLLELQFDDPRIKEATQSILKGGHHLLKMIDEILDLSRIESGRLAISIEPVSVGEMLSMALDLLQPLAAKAGVSISVIGNLCESMYVRADRQRLLQVLINLMNNAVKYNRPGGTISLQCSELPGRKGRISIADSGNGISREDQEMLFQPFQRFCDPTIEGTGLGLALSHRFINIMGGKLELAESSDTGSTFVIELDVVAPAFQDAAPAIEADLLAHSLSGRTGTVLYIEDNLSNMRLLDLVFGHLNQIALIPAMQGGLGLELAREHMPDLILLDINLPDIMGDEVLRRLKADPMTSMIPVVVLSADATQKQITSLRSLGAVEYLTKPLDLKRLFEVLRTLLPRRK